MTPEDRICAENTCGHLQCIVWWNTQALKHPGHDGALHDHGSCPLCQSQERERKRAGSVGI